VRLKLRQGFSHPGVKRCRRTLRRVKLHDSFVGHLRDNRRIAEDALGQNLHAVSDHCDHTVEVQGLQAERSASPVHRFHNIRASVEERPVEIENDDFN